MKRRIFVKWMGAGFLIQYIPATMTASQASENQQTASNLKQVVSVSKDGFEVVGTVQELNKNGRIYARRDTEQPVLVVRNPQNQKIVAVNPTCTHLECTVEFKKKKSYFYCPCHGSEFSLDGKVLHSPAFEPLTTYPVKQENNQIMVKLESIS